MEEAAAEVSKIKAIIEVHLLFLENLLAWNFQLKSSEVSKDILNWGFFHHACDFRVWYEGKGIW